MIAVTLLTTESTPFFVKNGHIIIANISKIEGFRPIVPLEVVYKLGYYDSFDTNCSSIRQSNLKIEQYLDLGLRRHRNRECGQLKCKKTDH